MTAIDTTTLETLADLSFEDFVGLHAIDQNRAEQYYAELESQAQTAGLLHVENYAGLAQGVATGGTANGQIINNFTGIYADDASIDFSWGSDARLRYQYELMRADIQARKLAIQNGGEGELDFDQTNQIQTSALNTVGLPPEASFFYTPLNILAEHDPDRAQFVFQTAIAGGDDSVADIIQDGLLLGFGATITGEQSLSEILADYAAQAEWQSNVLESLQTFVTEYGPQESAPITDRLELYQQLVNLAGATSGGLSQVADWVDSLPPGTAVKLLPLWAQLLHGAFEAAKTTASPLVLDIDGDGIELAALNGSGSVYWDIDLDGFGEASGWIAGGDGLLAIDLNADGIINDHSELFGDQAGSPNGFAALAAYDTNADDAITSTDAQFDDLLVWIDANSNGYSEADELHTLDDLGITSISLAYSNVSYTISGNEIKQESSFVINGQTRDIVDAWFAYDNVNTVYAEGYQLDVQTLYLPSLRGFGELPDLHIAMSQDETLLGMVQDLAVANAETILSTDFDFKGKVENILLRWADVDNVPHESRDEYIDAQHLEFLEKLLGESWNNGIHSDPGPGQANVAEMAYQIALSKLAAQILVQTAGVELFSGQPSYDLAAGEISAGGTVVDLQALDDLASEFDHSDLLDSIEFWTELIGMIHNVTDLSQADQSTKNSIDTIIQQNDPHGRLNFAMFYDALLTTTGNVYGDSSDNILMASENLAFMYGYEGDDILIGGTDGDTLYGHDGNDVLVGGASRDHLYGGDGNDVYRFTSGWGNDTLSETIGEGTDAIEFTDMASDDVWIYTNNSGTLFIQNKADPTDLITVNASRDGIATLIGQHVESVIFTDTVMDLTGGLTLDGPDTGGQIYGSNFSDTITGGASGDSLYGNDGHDVLIGLAGNDTLHGHVGNDILVGGAGNDYLYGGLGDDVYRFASGWGYDNVSETVGEGTDAIEFTDLASTDVWIYTGNYGYLFLQNKADPNDLLVINAWHNNYATLIGQYVESITFTDTVMDLTGGLTLNGPDTSDTIYGSNFGDTINGGAGGDTLYGQGGNDVLIGGAGNDYLYGGSGADTFLFEAISAFSGVDRIQDFSLAGGDMIDVSDLLTNYDPLTDAIEDFVWMTNAGSNTDIYIDQDGSGAIEVWTKIATIEGVTGLTDEAALETNGHLIAA